MKYINCPICGHKLLEGNDNSLVRVKCNKCKAVVEVAISSGAVALKPITASLSNKK